MIPVRHGTDSAERYPGQVPGAGEEMAAAAHCRDLCHLHHPRPAHGH